jgi:hypothetical protein
MDRGQDPVGGNPTSNAWMRFIDMGDSCDYDPNECLCWFLGGAAM